MNNKQCLKQNKEKYKRHNNINKCISQISASSENSQMFLFFESFYTLRLSKETPFNTFSPIAPFEESPSNRTSEGKVRVVTTSLCPYGKLQTKASAFHSARVRGVNVSETGHWVNAYNMSRKRCCITAWFEYYTVECVKKNLLFCCFSQLENKRRTLLLFS